jgi:hypothetical protein
MSLLIKNNFRVHNFMSPSIDSMNESFICRLKYIVQSLNWIEIQKKWEQTKKQ